MTLQQFEYIVALDRYRNFARAAEACNVTQPTLSAMLVKLEEELDVRLFDRTNRNVAPTSAGMRIIEQARRALSESQKVKELVAEEKGLVSGSFRLSVGPTIAPYIVPQLIHLYTQTYPQVELTINEMKAPAMQEALLNNSLDAGIAIAGNGANGLRELPLYTERFVVYLSEHCWRKLPVFKPENLSNEHMWVMKEAQCLRDSAFSFCKGRAIGRHIYEAGSIDTLVRIVDLNGGYTIIPEMHLPFLTEEQRKHTRRIEGDYLSQRRVSLYVREDYIRQSMLDALRGILSRFITLDDK
ncbi:MAG: LysR family transcriptional regulator [Bacteroidales bacterium]|nr:LysR family transcriptional regulator [Bacteroidales bacterium]